MDNEIGRFPDLGFRVGKRRLGMVAQHETGKAMECLFRRSSVDGSQRSCMARIQGM
jgi:hypothetical protein